MTTSTNVKKTSEILVTIALGEDYRLFYDTYFRKSQEDFAKRHGMDFLAIYEPIVRSQKHPSWQKLLIFKHPQIAEYERVVFVDADIYITQTADNPSNLVPPEYWGMVDNNSYKLESLEITDPPLYVNCPKDYTPPLMLNGGFFIANRKEHQELFENIFLTYPEQNCYEQGPLSYSLQRYCNRGIVLPSTYNAVLAAYRMKFGKGLSKIIDFFDDNYFIHFAGGIPIIFVRMLIMLDRKPNHLLTKMLRLVSGRYLDPFTTILLRILSLLKKMGQNYYI